MLSWLGLITLERARFVKRLIWFLGRIGLTAFHPIEEYDFYNGKYVEPVQVAGEAPTPVKMRIEVTLIGFSGEVMKRCAKHLEFWHVVEERILVEVKSGATPGISIPCLRLETIGEYDPTEDEFNAETFYTHSPDAADGEKDTVRRDIKRLFGFLYLRALRTGTRALSLERGSLLDVLLRLQKVRTGLWEHAIDRLRNLILNRTR